ncbi:hypothetical protein E8E14_013304 [Neopestalotiopsis sp. 37M]|nr:hypothetical protein E8E14_013304 [Neopestalotiopsis sp. 37M]
MRLLQLDANEGLTFTRNLTRDIPPYAILSHTWGAEDEEVTFQDVLQNGGKSKPGYEKILFCGRQAKRDGLDHFWIDTCCIDKTSAAELTESINSMFRWYRNAVHCYVYLPDVSSTAEADDISWRNQLEQSRWFTRGWTLQELLAPKSVRFFSIEGTLLGDRVSLQNEIHSVTRIKISALLGTPLGTFSPLERMDWSNDRRTTREEDIAYCMLGIFDVSIPVIYGEGKAMAKERLRKAIDEKTGVTSGPDVSSSKETLGTHGTNKACLVLPFGQNRGFVGRDSILTKLVREILPRRDKNDCQRTVLEGLGGIGKTQIALEAAYRVQKKDPGCSIFWVPAITITTFENAYRAIGRALGTPGIEDDKADVKLLVKTALGKCSADWLLIIDNIDDVGVLDGEGLRRYIPFSRKGSILFTTRNHEIAVELDTSPESIYAIGKMTEAEALELLRSRLQERQYHDIQATNDLLLHLVYLPLAIKQASAYMAKTRATTATYLKRCLESDEKQIKLLTTGFEDRGRYSRETNPIATTWLISFQHLKRTHPLAADYLKFICFLAEKDIPTTLLLYEKDEEARDEALGILEGYAFISIQNQRDAFDIHRLVRLAARNWVKQEWDVCYTKAIQRLAKVYPLPKHENRQTWMAYMPHAQVALIDHQQCKDKEVEADLLYVVAESHNQLGRYAEAEKLCREVLELSKSVLGAEHPRTLDSMDNLGLMLDNQGRYEEAEEMHRQTLELKRSVLGAEHLDTLSSINNLANVLYSQGKYGQAEKMYRQALELTKSVLGAEHPRILNSTNNLALVLDSQGRYEEAEEMHRQELALTKSVLGAEHPRTLDSTNNLALVLYNQGKYEEAESMHRQTLKLKKLVLGAEHPRTLDSINNLANVLHSQGKYEEAEEMHRETLELKRLMLGAKHPNTIASISNLANVLYSQGKYEEAEEMHREALELKKSVLGAEHPRTLDSMNALALVFNSARKYRESEVLQSQALRGYRSRLGPEHPRTLDSMNNLGLVFVSQGKYEEAEDIYQDTLQLQTRVLGQAHPSTLRTNKNLQLLLAAKARDALGEASEDSGDDGGVAV